MILNEVSVLYIPERKIVIGEFGKGAEIHLSNAKIYEGTLVQFMSENEDYKLIDNL